MSATGWPWLSMLAVAVGAALGALLRWGVGLLWNVPGSSLPLGTLVVNCAGGLLIGLAMVWFERLPNDVLRLLCVTGFLGGLTTFSTFSAESLGLVQRGEWLAALGHTLAHVLGALLCTAAGFRMGRWWLGGG